MNNRVFFLRKLVHGGTEHSFGIHVARMAGIPSEVIKRANDILNRLEKSEHENLTKNLNASTSKADAIQLSLVNFDDPVLLQIKEDILNTDINSLTPVEALMKLNEIKMLIK